MISLYRWKPDQKFGTWVDIPDLPTDLGHVPEGEIWWLDLDDPSPEEEDLVYRKFLPVHALTLEDITKPRREPGTVPHLPKVEEFPDYLFIIVDPLRPPPEQGTESIDAGSANAIVQLSTVLTERVLVTHHYQVLPSVSQVKQFLHRHGEQCGRGPDYLFHLVLDSLVDEFAPEIDRIVERLDEIEETMFQTPSDQLLTELIRLKRRVIGMRKTLILTREVLARLIRGEFELVNDREIAYYRNVFDHLVRYTELIEGAREMVSDLMQTHLAAVSTRLNRVMKLLAMVSTVILPMSLIASIYGMNFEHMPETKWQYGYEMALGLMAVVAIVAIAVFYRQKWFER
jgi:magnesium transporter